MSPFHYVGDHLLADPPLTGVSFPDGFIYVSDDDPADVARGCYQSALHPRIVTTRADDVQTPHHASWASSESPGSLPVRPEAEAENRSPFHLSGNSVGGFQSQSDCTPLSSIHYLGDGALVPPYNLHQPFASGSAQLRNFHPSQTALRRMIGSRELDRCPECRASPFPSAWTMDHLGCVHCMVLLPRSMVIQLDFLPPTAPHPATTTDRPRSPSTCPFQSRSRKGKSPQARVRRVAKTPSPAVQEFRCCPFTGSGNISLPCPHITCSPPPDIAFRSRQFEENEKWQRARKEAVASFSYENCGFYKLPIELVWMIIDVYPRLDYSHMRSIRAEPSVYNHRFEVLRNLIGVSKCCRNMFHNTYWETFEMALTYQRKRVPDPGQFDLGMESARWVSRLKELQGLRKTFWTLQNVAHTVRTLTFRVDRDTEIMQLFVDCLPALSNLHTLEIAPTSLPLVTLFSTAFKTGPQCPSVRKLIAPSGVHPILQSLPNLEELVCTRGEKPHILLTKVFQAYDSTNTITTFKNFELIGSTWTEMVGRELLRCFPKIQKIAMRKPTMAYLEKLTSLTEISEIELWVLEGSDTALNKRLKAKAMEILRKSKPRPPSVCECDPMDVGPESSVNQESETNEELGDEHGESKPVRCWCKPPKRVFRLKHLVRRHGQWGTPFWGNERVEEIEVTAHEE